MTRSGFHASHEQIAPGPLLRDVRAAQDAGFTAAVCSDHLAPWSAAQGQSGFAWSWLGAVLATTDLPSGVVTAPGQRYHPAVHAQAIATLAAVFPGRFWAALGSGQALDEHVTGDPWPRKGEREARLLECVEVVRALLADEEALHLAHEQWAPAILGSPVAWDLALPRDFEHVAAYVRPEDVHPSVLASADPGRHAAWLAELADLGFEHVYVHHVGQHQQEFLDVYGSRVLPALEQS
ncbi:LLM class flavin-dependent oxidoreductase [Quadrisphaera sp. DSM 44207]|uniref:LLM class flavin-dependent oxidoreductase n=1 Tax=Quadrisphaera sp. DSM 44207 TaxID=1881057 RepID=UPI00088DF723|nr:LLM class flavin-dependent oxidoreductase [Quadrisphaera sp. DSM 44207]SDQ41700.1 F420-dependent oxidoreductase, G6PDH family [Quadrisphaera sp. DSM 44207]